MEVDPTCTLFEEDMEMAWHLWRGCLVQELQQRAIKGREAEDLIFKLISFFRDNRVE